MNHPATITAPAEQDGPDPFIGLGYEVDQIMLGRNVILAKANAVRDAVDLLETAYNTRSLTNTKLAAEIADGVTAELRTIADQTNNLTAHLAKKTAELLNRRPRA